MNHDYTNNLISIFTVFISGLFGVIVAIVTWELANQREKRKFKQELQIRELNDKKELYVALLASLDMIIRMTKNNNNYSDIFEDLSINSAKIRIMATDSINDKLTVISQIIHNWSSAYRQSLPTKIADSNLGVVTNLDYKHREQADKIYPILMKEINELVDCIKTELEEIKKSIE
ncbi:hypothetical protein LA303_07930 [Candidatus Sulfidibacterium hydrothermale]|uniref:hypothetical protein n=1 Tax=Candidatus Sulfidibacterium hydrothermale TaxID=2875962 RepID=UPI001F0B3E62|nr:hypothetical protein [Candidatus Sulfidibacterium hydrothermale]UBM61352.1 hypothetical protein LA303_07930 [Candidatus Sulfidibacterium hydrothermale]